MTTPNDSVSEARQHAVEGSLDAAEAICRKLVQSNPRHGDALQLLSGICYQQGRLPDAIGFLKKAIEVHPDDPPLHGSLGSIHWVAGNVDESIACYQRALELDPRDAQIENDLGVALKTKGLHAEAEAHLRNSLRLAPNDVAARINLANTLRDGGKLDEAVSNYEQALQIEPDNFVAHNSFGMALLQWGRFDDAIVHLERALRIRPMSAPAYPSLGELALCDEYEFSAQQISQMESLSNDSHLAADEAVALHFTLGGIWEKRQNYDDAFAAYHNGNEVKRRQLEGKGIAFDTGKMCQAINATIDIFNSELFQNKHSLGSTSEVPIFVVGMPRSGTTLVQQIISSHPAAVGAGELQDIEKLTKALPTILGVDNDYPACVPQAGSQAIKESAQRYLASLSNHGKSATRIVDKMWYNFMYLGFIALLFPQARIVHCKRNTMDVCMSCFRSNFDSINWAFRLEDIACYYGEYARIMDHWREVLPLRMYEVQYEELIRQPDAVSRELIAFCGLPWDDKCLAFQDCEGAVQTASRVQVRQPLYDTSVGRWKYFQSHLLPLQNALEVSLDSL